MPPPQLPEEARLKTLVVLLFIVLIVAIGWFAFGSVRSPVRRRYVERAAPRRAVRRRTTVIDEGPEEVVEERRIID